MRDQRNRATAGHWAIVSPALLLLGVGCGDLGANPVSDGLTPSHAGTAGTSGGSAGAGGSGSGPVSCPSSITPGSVKAILGRNCAGCHGSQLLAGAPMPLVTWNDLQQPAKSNPA